MFLHNDKERFEEVITEAMKASGIPFALVEKDYFVTLFLKHLAEKEPLMIFKGGTCLSKCYHLVERFSEDIDINLMNISQLTQSRKKKTKDFIVETINELGLTHLNPDEIRSGLSHNGYKIEYPKLRINNSCQQELLVETMFLIDTFPTQQMEVSSIVGDFLIENGLSGIVKEYGIEPFYVEAQSLERTFVDKVFAIGTHYIENRIFKQSRHLYDLHKILPYIKINREMLKLFDEVREAWRARKGQYGRVAAEDSDNLPKLLREIISTEAYRDDYETVTGVLLYEDVSYDETIASFKKIASALDRDMTM